MAQQTINNGEAGLTVRNKLNANYSELYAAVLSNSVIVKTAGDFPAPSAGVIALADSTSYIIDGNVSTADRFAVGNDTSILSLDTTVNSLTYTGVGTMFTGVNKNLLVNNVGIACPNGTLLNMSDSAPKKSTLTIFQGIRFGTVKSLGTVQDLFSFRLLSSQYNAITASGLNFVGDFAQIVHNLFAVVSNIGTFINLGSATVDYLDIDNFDFVHGAVGAGSIFLSGIANSGNINTGGSGGIQDGRLFGPGTDLVNITVEDVRWHFQDNNRIQDSMPDAMGYLSGNTTATVINTINTPVAVAGTWTSERASHFTVAANGEIEYIGEKPSVHPIDISATIHAASGVNKDITIYLAIDTGGGYSVIAASGKTNRVGLTDPRNTTVLWQRLLNPGDKLKVYVENNTDTTDLVVEDAILRVR